MTSTQMALPPDSPFGRVLVPALAVTVGILFALTRAAGTPPMLTAAFGLLGVAYLPGLAASLWVENRFGLWASGILPLILSPVIAVAATLLLTRGGISLAGAPPWIVLIAVLGTALAPPPRRELEDWAITAEGPGFLRLRSDRHQVIGLATIVLLLIAAPLLTRDWIRASGDAAYHIGAASRVLLGGIPPDDPHLAGMSLRHFWGFDLYLALLTTATRVGADVLLAGGSLVGAFVLIGSGYRLLTLLALSHARALWGSVFLFFGLNGLRWLVRPVEILLTPGGGPLGARLAADLAAVPPPYGFPPSATFFLERFLVADPYLLALAYLLLFNMATTATLGENRIRWSVLAFLGAVGMLVFHTGVGAVALGVTVLAIPVVWVAARLNPLRGPGYEVTGTLIPMALALLVSAPYVGSILRGLPLEPARFLQFTLSKTVLFAVVLLPELALGFAVMSRFLAAREVRRQAWTVWAVLLVAVTLLVAFPGPHAILSSLVLAHVPLALAAGAAVPTWWNRFGGLGRTVIAVLLLLVLGTSTALGLRGYLRAGDPRDLRPETQEAIAWLREGTPPDAMIVDGQSDLALAAGRSLLYGDDRHILSLGYSRRDLVLRRMTYLNLLTGYPLAEAQRRFLERQRAPVYVVYRLPEGATRRPPVEAHEVFRNRAFVVMRLGPAEDATPREP